MTSSVRNHALYAALLSTILVLTSCRPDTTQSMREARARYSARDFAGSAEIYARIVKHEPRNGEALYGLGLARHESGDLAGAEWALARCIDLVSAKSEKVDAMVRLTDLYLARHADNPAYFEGAVKMAGLVTQWDPNLPAGHRLQGRIARIRGDRSAAAGNQNDAREFYRTSIDEYNRAAKLAPGDERVFAELASTEEAAGDYKSARDTYKRVLAIDPHACEPYDRLFVIETEHGTPDAAGSALNEAVAAPGCGTAFLEQMAETCIRLNKPAWFQTVADKLEHSETSTAGRLKLGSLYERASMPDRAIALYRQAETSDRAHWDTYRKATVRALLARKNIAEARQAFAPLDTASPDSDDVRLLRAALLVADNRAKDAIPQLQILIAHNAANCEAMVELARAYSSVGQQLMAESTLESCLRINPKYLPALREAARLYAAQNRNFEAEHAARAALAIAPRDAEARAVLENAHAAGAGGTP